jgi:uncharacterized membrane protein
MKLRDECGSQSVRPLLIAAWGTLCLLIIAAPILHRVSHAGPAVIYFFFSFICHQIPDRSFIFWGHPVAVCHRCTGIYWGLFLGSLFENRLLHHSPMTRRIWVLAVSVPLLLDALLPFAGLWTSNWLTRLLTGVVFGLVVSALLTRGLTELLEEFREPGLSASAITISREAIHE